jgi:hypothetical protein
MDTDRQLYDNHEEELQLAEDTDIELDQKDKIDNEYEKKRKLLEKTKIAKQTWSISEIYQKIKDGKLILDPDYQRNPIWNSDKKTAFIESLYMGIIIPPIYVVEVPSDDILEENKYEVVDGKQRLTTIDDFINSKLVLNAKNLEYFADLYGGKRFSEIKSDDKERTSEMLSSVLDIYVITANSPEFTKYDIFARLNKGSEKLKVNEIRRAIYHSEVTRWVTEFIESQLSSKESDYAEIFTPNDIKRFEDYGRFYRSIAFYLRSDLKELIVREYNSRPREMINTVLQNLQKQEISIARDEVNLILKKTLAMKKKFLGRLNGDYIIDACVPFFKDDKCDVITLTDFIINDDVIKETLDKSPSTTKNVNNRLRRVSEIVKEHING